MARKLILIHGYSDQGSSFEPWAAKLQARGVDAQEINICNYVTLNNEVTIPDIAEGLARAIDSLGWPVNQEFDAIVHSTGMLVIRAWLANSKARQTCLKHLVGLAPATWGSPLAHLGRSWLAAIVRGNKQFGPDFLNAGDRVLDGLELGSKFTWDLAHRDLLCDHPLFTTTPESPYVAVFIGNTPYTGIRELVDKPGMDGTVRWSGCGLNARKVIIDLRKSGVTQTMQMIPWAQGRLSIPMFAVDGKNHTTLLAQPEDDLADLIKSFLDIESPAAYSAWLEQANTWNAPALATMKQDNQGSFDGWQQFVIRVVDEYGEPVPDYVVDLYRSDPTNLQGEDLAAANVQDFDLDVHPYGADQSFRCFHVRIPEHASQNGFGTLWMMLSASTGTELLAYQGYTPDMTTVTAKTPVILDLSRLMIGDDALFCPFTTTLVEIRLTREPLPFTGQTTLMKVNPYTPG